MTREHGAGGALRHAEDPGSCGPRPVGWVLGEPGAEIPADAPLHTLLGIAARLVGSFWAHSVQGTGLSVAGLAILRMLVATDGLKSSEVASRGISTPATVTSVVDTLVRDGYLERRRTDDDRRVVRLFVTEAGRRKCDEVLTVVAPRLSACLDFVDPADEPVIRRFLVDAIERFGGIANRNVSDTAGR